MQHVILGNGDTRLLLAYACTVLLITILEILGQGSWPDDGVRGVLAATSDVSCLPCLSIASPLTSRLIPSPVVWESAAQACSLGAVGHAIQPGRVVGSVLEVRVTPSVMFAQ